MPATVSLLTAFSALPLTAVAAVLMDHRLGEPRRAHPLVGFGRWALWLERRLNPAPGQGSLLRLRGLLAWGLAVLPPVLLAYWLHQSLPVLLVWVLDVLLLWFALGLRSLREHGEAIFTALDGGDLPCARAQLSRIVSRDTDALDAEGVSRGAVESVLENGNDAVFAALFWFMVLGGPGALLFRLANTLDAMWGYKTARFLRFGWAAARLDDLFNYLPARLTALTYAVLGNWRAARLCWQRQAGVWESPNAGPVMAAGAGSLGIVLGGTARYQGQDSPRPILGTGNPPGPLDIHRALHRVTQGVWLWLILWLILSPAIGLWGQLSWQG